MSAINIFPKLYARAEQFAPQHPPCFDSRSEWVDYVAWAMAAQDSAVSPFVNRRSASGQEPGQFSQKFNFCADCTAEHEAAMLKVGRCSPTWLVQFAKVAA